MKIHFDDFIYGSIDGAVTTFAIVAGVMGASLPSVIILILGFANLFADGFSMAAANYQASKARNEFVQMKRRQEEWEIDNLEDQEKEEIREIYREKGFKDELLEEVVRTITSRRKVWVDTMMKEELGLTYLFIAHDLSMVRYISDRVAVMYLGRIVEMGERDDVYEHPLHPYTQALLSANPIPDPEKEAKRQGLILEGEIPSPANPPSGCRFHPRCRHATEICSNEDPLYRDLGKVDEHWVTCHHAEQFL